MHVEGAALGNGEQRGPEHQAIVEREEKIRPLGADFADDLRRVGVLGHDGFDSPLARERRDAAEPDVFTGIVPMRDHERYFDPLIEQYLEAAAADVMVGECDGAGHSLRSSTA